MTKSQLPSVSLSESIKGTPPPPAAPPASKSKKTGEKTKVWIEKKEKKKEKKLKQIETK